MNKMNISKKIKKVVLTATMMATMAMTVTTTAFASDADGSKSGRLPAGQEEPAHYHQPGWIAKEPTCTEPGLMQDICPYHPDYVWSEEEIPALGHNMGEWVVIKEPTYEEEGLKVRDCSRGDLHEEEVIPKLEKEPEDEHKHDYKVTEDTKATCEHDGRHVETCEKCGDEKVTIIPATGHDYGEWTVVKVPEIGIEGIEEHVCGRCGKIEERTIPALQPNDDDEVTPEDDDNDDVVNNEPDVLSEYIPQTGDTSNVLVYVVMMLGALLVLVAATRKEEQ